MAIPTGAGTEVLKRSALHINNSNDWHYIGSSTTPGGFSGASGTTSRTVNSDQIITILNWRCGETSGGTGKYLTVQHNDSDLSHAHQIVVAQSIPARSQFVYNDRMVLAPGDYLRFLAVNSTDSATAAYFSIMVYYIVSHY